jgi:hypothetical protein
LTNTKPKKKKGGCCGVGGSSKTKAIKDKKTKKGDKKEE